MSVVTLLTLDCEPVDRATFCDVVAAWTWVVKVAVREIGCCEGDVDCESLMAGYDLITVRGEPALLVVIERLLN